MCDLVWFGQQHTRLKKDFPVNCCSETRQINTQDSSKTRKIREIWPETGKRQHSLHWIEIEKTQRPNAGVDRMQRDSNPCRLKWRGGCADSRSTNTVHLHTSFHQELSNAVRCHRAVHLVQQHPNRRIWQQSSAAAFRPDARIGPIDVLQFGGQNEGNCGSAELSARCRRRTYVARCPFDCCLDVVKMIFSRFSATKALHCAQKRRRSIKSKMPTMISFCAPHGILPKCFSSHRMWCQPCVQCATRYFGHRRRIFGFCHSKWIKRKCMAPKKLPSKHSDSMEITPFKPLQKGCPPVQLHRTDSPLSC